MNSFLFINVFDFVGFFALFNERVACAVSTITSPCLVVGAERFNGIVSCAEARSHGEVVLFGIFIAELESRARSHAFLKGILADCDRALSSNATIGINCGTNNSDIIREIVARAIVGTKRELVGLFVVDVAGGAVAVEAAFHAILSRARADVVTFIEACTKRASRVEHDKGIIAQGIGFGGKFESVAGVVAINDTDAVAGVPAGERGAVFYRECFAVKAEDVINVVSVNRNGNTLVRVCDVETDVRGCNVIGERIVFFDVARHAGHALGLVGVIIIIGFDRSEASSVTVRIIRAVSNNHAGASFEREVIRAAGKRNNCAVSLYGGECRRIDRDVVGVRSHGSEAKVSLKAGVVDSVESNAIDA